MQESGKQNFLKGAAILAAASIFVKIVGAIYKIPLFNVLNDDAARGTFQVTYNVYTLILTISTAGIPAALSRLVSTAQAGGKTSLVKRYFSVAMPAFLLVGIAAMAVMLVFADAFAGLMNDSMAAPGIRVLAPAVLFVCIISVYRGYAQGFENMIPTAMSQVVEVVCKAAFGVAAAIWLKNMGYALHLVSAGAITGVTVGLGLSVPLLVWYKRRLDRNLTAAVDAAPATGWPGVLGTIMKVSIPITLSASFMSIMTVIDTSVVLGRLQSGLQMLTEQAARAEFGIYTLGLTVYNLPPAIVVPVSVSIIPAIAAAVAKGRKDEAGGIMQSSVKLVNLLAMPAGAGIMVLSSPILAALYDDHRQITSTVLLILGAASFFVCLQYVTTAILQANGHERVALLTIPVGAALKIILGYILVGNPAIGIIGTPIGTLMCFLVISALNLTFISVRIKEKLKFFSVFVKPLLCTVAMAGVAYSTYDLASWLGSGLIGTGRFAIIVYLGAAIVAAAAVYVALIIATRTVTKEDMMLVPKGEKLANILRIR